MIVKCLQCRTRYRVNELFFRESSRKVRCSRCRHVFVVDKLSRVSCSICGDETGHFEEYLIREYKGSPYAVCPSCAESLKRILEEST